MSRHVARRATAVAVVVGVACLAPCGPAASASAQELGVVYASVTDRNGEPVLDLEREEFRITEDGRPVEILTAQAGSEPMKVALLVDNGGIIERQQAINPVRDAIRGFVETLPPEHAVSLVTIGGHIGWRVDFTTDRGEVLESAREMHTDSAGIRFIDGVRETWDRWFRGDEAWPVFVAVLTDANEMSAYMNENRFNRFVSRLQANGVMVHSVIWSSRPQQTTRALTGTGLALNLTTNTGGRYTAIATATAYGRALRQLGADMGRHHEQVANRYRLLFERPDEHGTEISVEVLRPDLDLQLFRDRRIDP